MARRTPQTFLKRQREQKRAEKARQKLAKREARKQGLLPEGNDPTDNPFDWPDDAAEAADGSDEEAGKPSE